MGGERELAKAQKLARRGQDGAAEEVLREALQKYGDSAAVKAHLAVLLAKRRRFREASKLSEEAQARDHLFGLFRARVLIGAGKFSEALDVLRKFTNSFPENLLGWGYLLVAVLAKNRLGDARRLLEEHTLAADAEMRARLLVEVERILNERGVRNEPASMLLCARKPRFLLKLRRELQARSCTGLGMKLLEQGEPEAATYLLRAALLLDSDQPAAGFYLGLALLELDHPGEAAQAFKKVPDKSRLNRESRACLGAALYYEGVFEEAAELLEREGGDEISSYYAGLSRVALGEREEAAKAFARALRMDPSLALDRIRQLKDLLSDSNRVS